MARTSGKILLPWVVALLLIALVGRARAIPLCNIDSSQLDLCRPAVSGQSPPSPTMQCCNVVQHANLSCFCNLRPLMPAFGINPVQALALPRKCGLQTPPECRMS